MIWGSNVPRPCCKCGAMTTNKEWLTIGAGKREAEVAQCWGECKPARDKQVERLAKRLADHYKKRGAHPE